jgi:hypothetical protein
MVVVDKRLCLKEGEGEGEVVVRRECSTVISGSLSDRVGCDG